MRVRHRQHTAERHLDALADELRARGWAQLKMYAEAPPVLWVYPKGAEAAAVSVAAVRIGRRWVFQVSRLMEYPCHTVVRMAGVLDDVLQDRMGRRQAANSR
jgi:hypothetical protein